MNKKLLTGLLLISLPVCASTQWHELYNNGKSFSIDTSSIVQNGSQYRYWIKKNNSNGYSKILMVSDCSNNTSGAQQALQYDNNNKMLNKRDLNGYLEPVIPDSDASVAYNYICKAHFARLQKQAEEEAQAKAQEQKQKNVQNFINTGLDVGRYFIGR